MPKTPKVKISPPHRQPKNVQDPGAFDKKYLRIQLDLLDFDHHLWGWENLSSDQHIEFLKFIKSMEKQTWAQIKTTGGGKSKGTNHHQLEVVKFDKKAKDRLLELNLENIAGDNLFSLRINNVTRIYGVREEEFFRPIWHDPYHDKKEKAAYPVS